MDDTQVLVTGTVRWLDSDACRGVITGAAGLTYVFAGASKAGPLDVGQLVEFRDMGRGPVGRIAVGVRAVTELPAD